MKIKNHIKLFSFFFILSSNSFCSINLVENKDSQDAKIWIKEYLQNSSEHDLKLVSNLLYWSYERSMVNLNAQKASRDNLELNFRCWQNIAATRLNPSKELPNKIFDQDIIENSKNLYENYKTYRAVCDSYVYCIESILKKSSIENQKVKDGVVQLRKTARWNMGKALLSAGFSLRAPEDSNTKKSLKLPNWILQPFNFSINGFVDVDNKYNKGVTSCQNALLKAQETSDSVWVTIETSRSQFYKVYYEAVIEFIKSKKINFNNFKIMYCNSSSNCDLPEKL